MTDKKKDVGKNTQSEIIIYRTEDGNTKVDFKMKRFGLHKLNYVNYIKPVNPISVNILSIYLKRVSWRRIQLFGNSERLVLMARIIILLIIILT